MPCGSNTSRRPRSWISSTASSTRSTKTATRPFRTSRTDIQTACCFLVSPICATYCRFCTRRRKVGDPEKIPLNQYDSAFEYIRSHPEIRDVIMSGGDPMMLSDRRLEYIFQRLREIPHVEIIRLGSRITSHLPVSNHAGILRDGEEVPSHLYEYSFQPSS
jgi:coproporphyrinogen III oxidase-like Fe-S oxidoreductase